MFKRFRIREYVKINDDCARENGVMERDEFRELFK